MPTPCVQPHETGLENTEPPWAQTPDPHKL